MSQQKLQTFKSTTMMILIESGFHKQRGQRGLLIVTAILCLMKATQISCQGDGSQDGWTGLPSVASVKTPFPPPRVDSVGYICASLFFNDTSDGWEDVRNKTDYERYEWEMKTTCRYSQFLFQCFDEHELRKSTVPEDILMLRVADLTELKNMYGEMCANTEYFLTNFGCKEYIWYMRSEMNCVYLAVFNMFHDKQENIEAFYSGGVKSVCRRSANATQCHFFRPRKSVDNCSLDFLAYDQGLFLRAFNQECLEGVFQDVDISDQCPAPNVFSGKILYPELNEVESRIDQCQSDGKQMASCLSLYGPLSDHSRTVIERGVFNFDSYKNLVNQICDVIYSNECVYRAIANNNGSCILEPADLSLPVGQAKNHLCRSWGNYTACMEMTVFSKCSKALGRRWMEVTHSTVQSWCFDIIGQPSAAGTVRIYVQLVALVGFTASFFMEF